MILHSLTVKNFRAITEANLEFDDTGVTLIDGCNESGKTSLVEAFSALIRHASSSNNKELREAARVGTDEPIYICAEMTVGKERFVYSKCFKRSNATQKSFTELHFISPIKEELRSKEAHDYVINALAPEADFELWSRLRVEQSKDVGQLRDTASISALRRALDAQAGGDAPDGDDSVFDSVKAVYEKFFTKKRGDKIEPRGEYKKLIDEVEEKRSAHAEASTKEAGLAKDIGELEGLSAKLPRKKTALETVRKQLAYAKEVSEQLRITQEKVDSFQRNKELLQANQKNAETEWQQRTKLRELLAEQNDKLHTLQREIADAKTAAKDAAEVAEKQVLTAKDAAAKAQHERRAKRRVSERYKLAEIDYELTRLSALQRKDQALREQVSKLNQRKARLTVTESAIQQLRSAETVMREARALARAAATAVEISGHGNATVNGKSVDVETGWQAELYSRTDIRIAGITVSFQPPQEAAEAAREAEKAAATFNRLLEESGVASVAEAEKQRKDATEITADLSGLEGQLEALWGGSSLAETVQKLDELNARASAIREDLLDLDDSDDYHCGVGEQSKDTASATSGGEARGEVAPAESDETVAHADRLASLKEMLREAEDRLETADSNERLADERARYAENEAGKLDWQATQMSLNAKDCEKEVASLQEQLEAACAVTSDTALLEAFEAAKKAVMDTAADERELTEELERVQLLAEKHDVESAIGAVKRHEEEVKELRETIVSLRSSIQTRSEDGLASSVAEARASLERAEARLQSMRGQAETAKMLFKTLDAHRREALERYAEPLRAELIRYGRRIFGADFDVNLDEKLTVSARQLDGTTIDYEQLSGGAKEQFALLTRIVCAQLAGGNRTPIFLDDTLGYSDPQRRQAVAGVIDEAGKHSQVIVLTCDEERFMHLGSAKRYSLGVSAEHH